MLQLPQVHQMLLKRQLPLRSMKTVTIINLRLPKLLHMNFLPQTVSSVPSSARRVEPRTLDLDSPKRQSAAQERR